MTEQKEIIYFGFTEKELLEKLSESFMTSKNILLVVSYLDKYYVDHKNEPNPEATTQIVESKKYIPKEFKGDVEQYKFLDLMIDLYIAIGKDDVIPSWILQKHDEVKKRLLKEC